ncbi:MAG: LytTR family transcriptional regulator [Saprospiraceae bacterium]|nr:LytTR family transcriptional regulator [Saprospiraceae bacterium]
MKVLSLVSKTPKIIPLHLEIIKTQETYVSGVLTISTSKGIEIIQINSIIYLKSDSNYTYIFLESGRSILVSKTLKNYELLLKNSFIRVHNSYLVNPDYIQGFLKKTNHLLLCNHLEIPVSRSKKLNVKNLFKKSNRN